MIITDFNVNAIEEDKNFKYVLDEELESKINGDPFMRSLYKHLIIYAQYIIGSDDLYEAMGLINEVMDYAKFKANDYMIVKEDE